MHKISNENRQNEGIGTIQVSAFNLPLSSLTDDTTRSIMGQWEKGEQAWVREFLRALDACQSADLPKNADIRAVRQCQAEAFYRTSSRYKRMRDLYKVDISNVNISGVDVEVFTPAEDVSAQNRERLLINLHGGGFQCGSRTISHLESIPIAAVGKIKVMSIDYRQAPDFAFPAASEDVAAVYRELLKSYRPGALGIYGCSAGALLTAESLAWFEREMLPSPGAIGMVCNAAAYWMEGDSAHLAAAIGDSFEGVSLPNENPYFEHAEPENPLAFPLKSKALIAKFPPSLLITASRDVGMSSVIATHRSLIREGVEAELHVFEGLDHAFHYDPDLPDSKDTYDIVCRFFDRRLR